MTSKKVKRTQQFETGFFFEIYGIIRLGPNHPDFKYVKPTGLLFIPNFHNKVYWVFSFPGTPYSKYMK